MAELLYKRVWQIFIKLNKNLPYNLAIILLVIYPRDLETYINRKPVSEC